MKNSLIRCIQLSVLAALWSLSAYAASPGKGGGDDERDPEMHATDTASVDISGRDRDTPGGHDDTDVDDDQPDDDAPDTDTDSHGGSDDGAAADDSHSGGGDDDVSGSDSGSGGSGSGSDDESGSHHGSGSSGSSESESSSSSGSSGSTSGSSGNSGEGSQLAQHGSAPIDVDHDEHGNERVAGEALMAASSDDIARALAHGFQLVAQNPLTTIDREVARLRVPAGQTVEQGIETLHQLAPNAVIAANNVYRSSDTQMNVRASAQRGRPVAPRGVLGIIDTGADPTALGLEGGLIASRSFAAGPYTPRDHGTIVASLAASMGMRVHVADVFGTSSDGALAASADAIAGALDWLIANHVAVINISIEGPQNAVLQQLVQAAAQRGHIIVAAAGNGGPLAAPAFPAAYEGAVAVTAIDGTGHAYRRANRGAYVAFAAQGVDLPVTVGDHEMTVTGTSFSAPIVASRLAAQLREPSMPGAQHALQVLRSQAIDLGSPGRDPIFGWGAISSSP